MMKSKTIIAFFVAIFCITLSTSAQESPVQAIFTKEKGNYIQTATTGTILFQLKATEAQVKKMKELTVGKDYKLETKKSGDHYNCKLTVTTTTSIGVTRIFSHVTGIEHFHFEGQQKNLAELPGILGQLR